MGEEKVFCPFDDRTWDIGFEDQTENEKIIELILKDDNIAQWNELFTLQIFDHLPVSAAEFIAALEKASKENIPSSQTLQFNIIEKDPLNIFESSFIFNQNQKPPEFINNSEYNIGRVIKGKTALYYLRYSTKDSHLFEQNKESWIKRFKLAYIAEKPQKQQQGKWISFTSSGVYEQGQQLNQQNDNQFIDSQKLGYSMTFPKNWIINQVNDDLILPESTHAQEALSFTNPSKSIEGKVTFLDLQEPLSNTKASNQYFDSYQKQHPQTKLISQGNIQNVIGQEGYYFIVNEGSQTNWMTCFSLRNTLYCLEMWTSETQFDKVKNTLENIIQNFQTQPKLIEKGSLNQGIGNF